MNEEKIAKITNKLNNNKLQELFIQILKNRDLSRAGELFSVPDSIIIKDLVNVIKEITNVISLPDYVNNDNDQSVVEICITRVTSCIRETGSIEQHCEALVNLLESCLHHNLQITNHDEDPPHAKISSDIISCIFLNFNKKSVMQCALPVAVKFLHKGNKELSRNMASYLSLVSMEHANLLTAHLQPIMDSIISGNYPLCRVLPSIYEVSPEPFQGHAMALVSLLPHCDNTEKLALLKLFEFMARDKPSLLEASVPQLCEYLTSSITATPTLQIFLNMVEKQPSILADQINSMKQAANQNPQSVCLVAQIMAELGKLNKNNAHDALNLVLEYLPHQKNATETGSQNTLSFKEALTPPSVAPPTSLLHSSFPLLFNDKVLIGSSTEHQRQISNNQLIPVNNVTVVNVGSTAVPLEKNYTRRPTKLGDSRSTGRLHTVQNSNTQHRSMTRLNSTGVSIGGLHKSLTKLSISREMNNNSHQQHINSATAYQPLHAGTAAIVAVSSSSTSNNNTKWTNSSGSGSNMKISKGGVTVTTISSTAHPPKIQRSLSQGPVAPNTYTSSIPTISMPPPLASLHHHSVTVNNSVYPLLSSDQQHIKVLTSGSGDVSTSAAAATSTRHSIPVNTISNPAPYPPPPPPPEQLLLNSATTNSAGGVGGAVNIICQNAVISRRRNNTSVTFINQQNNSVANQRMSVFEPYPMRDTIQHFCEKHLDKIKTYMESVSLKVPSPTKCTIEERRQKKTVKLYFACPARGQHCLYSKTSFTMRTKNPRIWIHLMFISLQAKHSHALSTRDTQVASLKHCWDILTSESKTFLTLVTSAFPCAKEQETILNELRQAGYFDVFQVSENSTNDSVGSTPVHSNSGNSSTESAIARSGAIPNNAEAKWECFLCAHPEKAIGFLKGDTHPVIEGQLKEKKGKWRLFRRWRTRYFTLSGAHLSCKGSSGGESIDINQIQSVRVARSSGVGGGVGGSGGSRNIPKAFEIFTENQTLILKPSDGKNAEEWVQCLSVVVAHSRETGGGFGSATNSKGEPATSSSTTTIMSKDNNNVLKGKSNSLPTRGWLGGGGANRMHI